MTQHTHCDLGIIGAGPAGISTAINAASEGLKVTLIEGQPMIGGQALASKAVENYMGFPEGLTGEDLFARSSAQLDKFDVTILSPAHVVDINKGEHTITAVLDDDTEIECRSLALTMGLSLNRLEAKGVGAFLNRGVSYGTPAFPAEGQRIIVVGGANSAGQAAVYLATARDAHVTMLVRGKGIEDTMSSYLIERITTNSHITVLTHTNVLEVQGNGHMHNVIVQHSDEEPYSLDAEAMYIYIGGRPRTAWLNKSGEVTRTEKGFIVTGKNPVLPFETSMPGVFAAGDVREGSIKRVASAVGEGSALVAQIHKYLTPKGA